MGVLQEQEELLYEGLELYDPPEPEENKDDEDFTGEMWTIDVIKQALLDVFGNDDDIALFYACLLRHLVAQTVLSGLLIEYLDSHISSCTSIRNKCRICCTRKFNRISTN